MRFLPLLVLPLAGCPDRTIAEVTPVQDRVETMHLSMNRNADILFLIDNSGSMAEEQASLLANFGRFMGVLQSLDGGLPNVHIGVATSNLGAKATDGTAASAFMGCTGAGDDGALQTDVSINGRFIIDEEIAGTMNRNRNYSGTLEAAFSAIADVGTAGCGIEQHLGAVERALENPVNAGFLREDAKLAVIVIGDEDDCSLAHKALFEGSTDGPVINFRCTSDGIECDDTPDLSQPGVRTTCHPREAPQYLESVDRYVDFLRGLKKRPDRDVIVAGIIGNNDPFEIVRDAQGHSVLGPSCVYGGTQNAFPALRTSSFLDQFGYHVQKTICGADLTSAMVEIGALLKESLGDPCFRATVVDQDPNTTGLQAECTVTDVRVLADGSEQEIGIIPECGSGAIPCWRIEEDQTHCYYTSTHLRLVVDRGGAMPSNDVEVRASCVTNGDAVFL